MSSSSPGLHSKFWDSRGNIVRTLSKRLKKKVGVIKEKEKKQNAFIIRGQ